MNLSVYEQDAGNYSVFFSEDRTTIAVQLLRQRLYLANYSELALLLPISFDSLAIWNWISCSLPSCEHTGPSLNPACAHHHIPVLSFQSRPRCTSVEAVSLLSALQPTTRCLCSQARKQDWALSRHKGQGARIYHPIDPIALRTVRHLSLLHFSPLSQLSRTPIRISIGDTRRSTFVTALEPRYSIIISLGCGDPRLE